MLSLFSSVDISVIYKDRVEELDKIVVAIIWYLIIATIVIGIFLLISLICSLASKSKHTYLLKNLEKQNTELFYKIKMNEIRINELENKLNNKKD